MIHRTKQERGYLNGLIPNCGKKCKWYTELFKGWLMKYIQRLAREMSMFLKVISSSQGRNDAIIGKVFRNSLELTVRHGRGLHC